MDRKLIMILKNANILIKSIKSKWKYCLNGRKSIDTTLENDWPELKLIVGSIHVPHTRVDKKRMTIKARREWYSSVIIKHGNVTQIDRVVCIVIHRGRSRQTWIQWRNEFHLTLMNIGDWNWFVQNVAFSLTWIQHPQTSGTIALRFN